MRGLGALLVVLAALVATTQPADAAPPPWYPPMRWVPASTENFETGRGGAAISYIVIHATDGAYNGTLSWFQDPASRLSAHYVIRASDGLITQLVSEADTAFQARGINQRSIGIEHEFDPSAGVGYTDAEYRSSASLVCAIARRYAIPLDRAHIIGHSEVPGTDHRDPGPSWDWNYYMSLVRSCGATVQTSSVLAVGAAVACSAALCAPAAGLQMGADGQAVLALQLALVYLGHLREADVATGAGHFGPRTLAAVQAFQRARSVPATGFYGEMTASALRAALAQRPPDAPAVDLAPGDESAAVAQLQRALGARGYMSVVTGYFGALTKEAVRRFQADHGIIATGNYGPLTRGALALH